MRHFLLLSLLFVAHLGFAQAYGTVSPQIFAQQTQALRELQYQLQSLQSRLEAIEQRQATINARLSSAEKGDGFATKSDLAALRADLTTVRNSQNELREEIVKDVSSKVTKLINQRDADAKKAIEEAKKAAQKSGYEHIVQSGETISAIAQAYKVSAQSILKANKIKDPTKIRVGQKLFVPDP